MDVQEIASLVDKMRTQAQVRDKEWHDVTLVRHGQFDKVAPDLFDGPIKAPVVANEIDVSARYFAGVLSASPSITCSSASLANKSKREFHQKRGLIANNYIVESQVDVQMIEGADQYNTLGALVGRVVPSFKDNSVKIKVINPLGCYWVNDQWEQTVRFARVFTKTYIELLADYPEVSSVWALRDSVADRQIKVIQYEDKNTCITFLPELENAVLEQYHNELEFCSYVVAHRPGLDDCVAGAYRDVIWLQIARHKLNVMLLEGVEKAVNAPVALPTDADEIQFGRDVTIRTDRPESVRRVDLGLPSQAFAFPQMLASEQGKGSMTPEALSGNVDASIITGQGVKQLQQGWNDQVAVGQRVIAQWYKNVLCKAFMTDVKLFPDRDRDIGGHVNGTPYEITYRPSRDIKDSYSVDVRFGYAAGLDPNRSYILLSQMFSVGTISKETLIAEMNLGINPTNELLKVSIDRTRDAILNGVSMAAQNVGSLMAAGADPTALLQQIAEFTELLGKGKPEEEAAALAFAPKPPPPSLPGEPQAGPAGAPPAPGGPEGVVPDQATEGPGGRPDFNQFFAGITASGAPNLSATTSRMAPTAQ